MEVFKWYLQMTHLIASSSRPQYLNDPLQQHMKQHARSRKPQISQSRFMRTLPSLSWEDGSKLHWKTLIIVCPKNNNENKPGIKALMAQRSHHKKDYSHSLPPSVQKWSHKEESNHPKSSKTVSACKLSKVWGGGKEAPQVLAIVTSCCISLLSEATPLHNC